MKVLIKATRTTEYATIVEMTSEDFQRYQDKLDLRNHEAAHALNKMIDVKDWQNDALDEIEIEEWKDES